MKTIAALIKQGRDLERAFETAVEDREVQALKLEEEMAELQGEIDDLESAKLDLGMVLEFLENRG